MAGLRVAPLLVVLAEGERLVGVLDVVALVFGVLGALAPASSLKVGAPDGALTTPMSFMNTPRLKPVPTAFEKASLAAKRLA